MDLSIKKDKRNNGLRHHKMPRGTGDINAKIQAFKDMKEDLSCNYMHRESTVLQLVKYPKIVFS